MRWIFNSIDLTTEDLLDCLKVKHIRELCAKAVLNRFEHKLYTKTYRYVPKCPNNGEHCDLYRNCNVRIGVDIRHQVHDPCRVC